MNTNHINDARHELIALHKAIIDAERVNLERLEGRLNGAEMLRRLIADERFRWLQDLTALIARVDETLESDAPDEVGACFAVAQRLLTADGAVEPFRTEYARLLQDSPDVVLAHASAVRALKRCGQRDGQRDGASPAGG